jgi:hypothetical protein
MAGATIANTGTYFYGFAAGDRVNREDLLDLITNLDPWDTPWVSQAPKVRATGVTHEWLKDYIPATSTSGAIEGAEFSIDSDTQAVRVSNYTQIFRRDVAATETQRSVNPAGFKDAYAYTVQKATKAVARNIEATVFVSNTSASGASAAARALKTFQDLNFLISALAQSTAAVSANGAGAPTTFVNTRDLGTGVTANGNLLAWDFASILETVYGNGGNPESVFVSPAIKRQISHQLSLAATTDQTGGHNTRFVQANTNAVHAAVDVYDTDYGLIQVVMSRWVPEATDGVTSTAGNADGWTGTMFVTERGVNRLAWLRPVQHVILGKSGDSVRGIVVGEVTLEILNEKANGYVRGIRNPSSLAQSTA